MTRHASLLDDLEADLLADKPVGDVLRKCVLLGGRVNSPSLREWASRELGGYPGSDELPDYRVVFAPIQLDGMNGSMYVQHQRIRPGALPDFAAKHISERVELRDGIGTIEALARRNASPDSAVKMSLPGGADLAAYMNTEAHDPYTQILDLYWSVSPIVLTGVVEHVKSTLAGLLAEMRAGTPQNAPLPSSATADQAVRVAIHGDNNRVTLAAASRGDATVGDTDGGEPPGWRRWARVGSVVVGSATVVAGVVAVVEWLA